MKVLNYLLCFSFKKKILFHIANERVIFQLYVGFVLTTDLMVADVVFEILFMLGLGAIVVYRNVFS